jgi:protein-tyrosine phosphatase
VTDSPYRILFVCTGNICRSPFMERLTRARLDTSLGSASHRIEVSSAGTWALVGESMTDDAAEVLRGYGGDSAGFVARAVRTDEIEAADLVLTATRDHRSFVVTEVPRAAGKTATLREFARLLTDVTIADVVPAGADPAAQMATITASAFAKRGLVPAVEPAEDDVPDPYRGPREGYVVAARLIDGALSVPLSLLAV